MLVCFVYSVHCRSGTCMCVSSKTERGEGREGKGEWEVEGEEGKTNHKHCN